MVLNEDKKENRLNFLPWINLLFKLNRAVGRFLAVALLLVVSACATPIGISRVDPSTAYGELTSNALSSGRPSSFSSQQLLNLNLYEAYEKDPTAALAKLHATLSPTGDEDRLFALAELSFLYAEETNDRSYHLAAAIYAYAFLLPGGNGTPPGAIDPRARWAVDIYNQALAAGLSTPDGEFVVLEAGRRTLPFGELVIDFDPAQLNWAGFRFKNFVAASDLEVRGLRNRYRWPGVGAALNASIEPLGAGAAEQQKRIPSGIKVPVTAFLRLKDARENLSSGKLTGKLEVYNVDSAKTVRIGEVDVPVEYETTSALAYTLEGARVWDFEIAGFRAGDFRIGPFKSSEDQLFMLSPHRRGRIPVVLVHGTASSPARWAELVNELQNDRKLLDSYEIWYFIYNTGNPIAYSAMLLRDALVKVVAELDPAGTDPGLKQMVVIGHSQGGLLTKMTAIDSGMKLWPFSVPPEELDVSAETRDLLTRALIVKPLPFVKQVIFVATPHRGSYQALGILGALASWLVRLPVTFTKMSIELLTLQSQGILLGHSSGIPTSIDNMNPNNAFIQKLAEIPVAKGIIAHSIIAVEGDGPPEEGGDGVVKYKSAHIDGVASEKIVRSGHSTQGHPETIQEIKRILLEHIGHR